jgi:hypothetical protein
MPSTRKAVRLDGIIKGQGLESTCEVSAVEVRDIATGQTAYTQFTITSVAKTLPEGRYEAWCNGQKSIVKYENGYWLGTN